MSDDSVLIDSAIGILADLQASMTTRNIWIILDLQGLGDISYATIEMRVSEREASSK